MDEPVCYPCPECAAGHGSDGKSRSAPSRVSTTAELSNLDSSAADARRIVGGN